MAAITITNPRRVAQRMTDTELMQAVERGHLYDGHSVAAFTSETRRRQEGA